MSAEVTSDSDLAIAHVLFTDIVGYSNLLINEQSDAVRTLSQVVCETEQFRRAEGAGKLVSVATGDGIALAFFTSPDSPVRCAIEIAQALKQYPELKLRMGINSGPVDTVSDVNQHANVAGGGINLAQRVMDCGDAGHILLSKRLADDLGQYGKWRAHLHDLGSIEVKHGVRVDVVNLCTDAVGNREVPARFRQRRVGLRRRRFGMAAATLLLVSASGLGAWYVYQRSSENIRVAAFGNDLGITIPAQSVAVLPFDNLSSDQENAFFADGIQDDLLTSLARIKDLKVISRSSVMSYRGAAARKLREIRRELGVAAILEGSVRRVADRVLVNVQLIDTATESHIWAQRYDRTLADSISLQGELAAEIATALAARITPDEKTRVENKPTESSDAYVLYLKGREVQLRPEVSPENYRAAVNFYQKALAVDPKFVLARAQLAQMQTSLYGFESSPALLAEARSNADEAVRLDPHSGEAHLALAWCMFTADLDPDGIKRELETALRLLPNDGYVALSAAILQKFKGWKAESRGNFERAVLLNPREGKVFYNYATLLRETSGEKERARWALDRALELAPDSVFFRLYRAHAELEWTGDVSRIKAIVAALPAGKDPDGRVTALRCDVALLERNFPAALQTLAACPLEQIPLLEFGFGGMVRKELVEGLVRFYAGDRQGAYEVLEAARWKFETDAEEHPGEGYHLDLASVYAAMGWKDAAKAEFARFNGEPDPLTKLGFFALLGESELALPLLQELFPTFQLNRHQLRLHPQWDVLRNDARFQKLVAETN